MTRYHDNMTMDNLEYVRQIWQATDKSDKICSGSMVSPNTSMCSTDWSLIGVAIIYLPA